jgi:hypothetical protein
MCVYLEWRLHIIRLWYLYIELQYVLHYLGLKLACESDLTVHDIALESDGRNYAQRTGNFKIGIWHVIHFISVISQAQSEAFPSWIPSWGCHVRNSINRSYQRLLDPIISPIITELWRNILQAKTDWIFSQGWLWRILQFGYLNSVVWWMKTQLISSLIYHDITGGKCIIFTTLLLNRW